MAELSAVIAELRWAGDADNVNQLMRRRLSAAVRPFAPLVRAAILNTPSAGTKPWPPQVPGLRLRIARCVVSWAKIEAGVVTAGVEVDPSRMPSGQYSLPLMLEGAKLWRHPVFGNMAIWVGQPSYPYFYSAMSAWGPASARALDRAMDDITAVLEAGG